MAQQREVAEATSTGGEGGRVDQSPVPSVPQIRGLVDAPYGPAVARAMSAGGPLSNRGLARLLARKKLQSTLANDDIYDDFDEVNEGPTEFREEILNLINPIDAKGLTETDAVRFTAAEAEADTTGKTKEGAVKSGGGIAGWFTAQDLDVGRGGFKKGKSETEMRMAAYTTCGDFMSRVWAKAEIAAKKRNKKIKIDFGRADVDGQSNKVTPFLMHLTLQNEAWHAGSELGAKKPKPGDCYYLEFLDSGKQSHVGFIKSITDRGDGKQTWVTVDGGQRSGPGTPDKILERTRLVDAAAGIVFGGENADNNPRRLRGWLDVDQVVFYAE
jgi:hypothetical protein